MSSTAESDVMDGICPHLGLADDAESHATYATEAHRCYRLDRPTKIASSHQERFCLSAEFEGCPIFRGEGIGATTAPAPATRPRQQTAQLDRPRGANTAARPAAERPVRPGSLGPRPRPGGMSMKTMTIGLFALAAVIAVLAFAILRISGGDDDAGLTPAQVGATQTAVAKTPTVVRTTSGATTAPGTPGTPGPTVSGTARPTTSGTAGAGGRTYKVKSGDNCGTIAADNKTTVEEIRRLNPSINAECTNLNVDQEIKLP